MKKFKAILCTAALALLFTLPTQAADTAKLEINIPSVQESTIASGRSFYVLGSLSGYTYTAGDTMTVQVTSKSNPADVVRTVSTDRFANDSFYINETSGQNDMPAYFDGTTEEDIVKSGIPDLIFDSGNPDSFFDGTQKCYFDSEKFTALIYGGAVPAGMNDFMQFRMADGNSYMAIPEGEYVVTVTIADSDGNAITSVEKEVTIGVTPDKILARFSPSSHFNAVQEFASRPEHNYRIYSDPFPGYWNADRFNGADKFCEIKPEWRANDALEYTAGKVHFVIYNVSPTSTTYSVEIGQLQYMEEIEKPDRLVNYYYSTGEPGLIANQSSQITVFDEGDKLQLVRAETSTHPDEDGVFNQDSPVAEAYDFNLTDGVTAKAGETVSLYGVTAPIQIDQSDIISTGANSYELKNKLAKVTYHLTGEGIDKTITTPVTLKRISGGWDNYSEMEFKHNIPITAEMEGKQIRVQALGYDAHDTVVDGSAENFVIAVQSSKTKEPQNPETPAQPEQPKPQNPETPAQPEQPKPQNPETPAQANQTKAESNLVTADVSKNSPVTGDETSGAVIAIYALVMLLTLAGAAAQYRRMHS